MPDGAPDLKVLIVGASSGIGRETALLYARRGARLTPGSRSRDALEKVARECTGAGAVEVMQRPTEVLGRFRQRGSGQLVLVGSLLGQAALPYQGAYVASRFAVNGLVRLLRQENRDPAAYRMLPLAFDVVIGPFMLAAGFSRETVAPNTGSVSGPVYGRTGGAR
jgi:short-subunit dehydrogenase